MDEIVVLPAFLASALVNGDITGLEDSDYPIYNQVLEYLDGFTVVDCGEPWFTTHHCDCPSNFIGDVAEFKLLEL